MVTPRKILSGLAVSPGIGNAVGMVQAKPGWITRETVNKSLARPATWLKPASMPAWLFLVYCLVNYSAHGQDVYTFFSLPRLKVTNLSGYEVHVKPDIGAAAFYVCASGRLADIPLADSGASIGYAVVTTNGVGVDQAISRTDTNRDFEIVFQATTNAVSNSLPYTLEEQLSASWWYWHGFYVGFGFAMFAVVLKMITRLVSTSAEMATI